MIVCWLGDAGITITLNPEVTLSDSDYAKKLWEREDLDAFLIAYERATGARLTVSSVGERPDFICTQLNGRRIGVELTKVYASTHERRRLAEFEAVLGWEPITGFDIAWQLDEAAHNKDANLKRGGWRLKHNILVLQVYERPLKEVADALENQVLVSEISAGSSFQQIWIAGFHEQEAYSQIDLYSIKPVRLRGYYPRPFEKPYG